MDEAPDSSAGDEHGGDQEQADPGEKSVLSTVDRYYLAWNDYLTQNGQKPRDRQLSAFLA